MATFKVVIRDSKRKDGKTNIKIRVTHKRQAGYIATEYYVFPDEFDQKGERVTPVNLGYDESNSINMKLLGLKGSYAIRLDKIKDKVKHYTLDMVIQYLKEEKDSTDMFVILDNKIAKFKALGNVNYMNSYKCTRGAIFKYLGYEMLPLEVISYDWLSRFEFHMKKEKMGPNTIGTYMRNIRTCFNDSITMGLVELNLYPFRRYRIPKGKTRKRNISKDETTRIATIEIKDHLMAWARDMYMLSFYLIGINMRDLMFVKKVDEGRIFYIRSKGKKDYSIKVFPEAQAIIDRYPGKKYLLNTMDNYADYRSAVKRINKKLKDVAGDDMCKIGKPLTTYYARHTWATIASSLGVSRDTIRYALGHATSSVTDIYIDYDLEQVDQANRKVIDHINTPLSESPPSPEK